MLGFALGDYIAARAVGGKANVDGVEFIGQGIGANDFHLANVYDIVAGVRAYSQIGTGGAAANKLNAALTIANADMSGPLNWLWTQAQAEWAEMGGF